MTRLVIAVALVLSLGGCAIWGPEGGPGGAGLQGPSAGSTPPPVDAVSGADGVQRVSVEVGDDLRFTPSVVRARPGEIEFVFHNTGSTPHDARFLVPGEPATGNLNGGQNGTVRVTVSEPGTYPFPCLYHDSSGMVGQLIVTP